MSRTESTNCLLQLELLSLGLQKPAFMVQWHTRTWDLTCLAVTGNMAAFPHFSLEQYLLSLQTHSRVIYETFKLYKYSLILTTGLNKVFFVMMSQLMQCIKDSFDREVKVQTKRWSLQGHVWHHAADCWPGVDRSKRQFSYNTQTDNIKHSQSHV